MEVVDNVAISLNLVTPSKRFIFGAAAATVAVWLIQPSHAFTSEGIPRPWTVSSGESDEFSVQPTPTPWWISSIISGVAFSTLV